MSSVFQPTNVRETSKKRMEMMSRSSGIHEAASSSTTSWRRLQRSNSLLLASELADDSKYAKVGAYQRLSRSMRISDGSGSGGFFCRPTCLRKRRTNSLQNHRTNIWIDKFGKLFSLKGIRGGGEVAAAPANNLPEVEVAQVVNKKKRSSWLPDPDRRWPVQGW